MKTLTRVAFLLIILVFVDTGHAFYNPSTGRWINRDPIEESGGDNVYSFVLNDSIGLLDGLGNEPIDPSPDPTASKIQLSARLESDSWGTCGKFSWPIKWELLRTGNTRVPLKGAVVQVITIDWNVRRWGERDKSGKRELERVPNGELKSLRAQFVAINGDATTVTYTEAWPADIKVSRGAFSLPFGSKDTFSWEDEGNSTVGEVKWNGVAWYTTSKEPADWKANPGTMAGILPAVLGAAGGLSVDSNLFDHTLQINWNCCGAPGPAGVGRPTKASNMKAQVRSDNPPKTP